MRKILVLAGPSAVGKTTVAKALLSQDPRFDYIRSATTRAPRGDGHDSEYIYLSVSEFERLIEDGGVLEYTRFAGNLYGTPTSEIERIFADGKIPLLILDINGVRSLKAKESDFGVFSVYMTADIEVLDKRLYDRLVAQGATDAAYKAYESRKAQNRKDLGSISDLAEFFDAFVENTTPDETANNILAFFNA